MQFCQDHWNRLRQEVNNRGLSRYVAPNGDALFEKLKAGIEEGDPVKSFDPLAEASVMISGYFIHCLHEKGGEQVIQETLAAGHCPLCVVDRNIDLNENEAPLAEDWITGCVQDLVEKAQELGLELGEEGTKH